MTVLIIGGGGFIGTAIARKLVATGARVVVPARRRDRAKHLITLPTIDVVEADVHDAGVLAGLMAGVRAVINLAGILHGDRGNPYGERFKAVHVDLPRKIAEAAAAARVPRLLHMSALGVSADAPSMYLRSKAAGEVAVAAAATGVAVTIFRPSVVFGRDDSFVNLFAQMQRLFPVIPLGRATARLQPMHVEDVAQAFANALESHATRGRTYELAGPRAYSLREIVEFAGRASGHPRRVIDLPVSLAYLQALMMEFAPFEILSRDNLDSLKQDSICSQPVAPELGIVPVTMESVMAPYLSGRLPRERYVRLRDRAGR